MHAHPRGPAAPKRTTALLCPPLPALCCAALFLCLLLCPGAQAQCLEGDCVNGSGTKITRGHKYVGEFENNHRHGYGMYQFPNGDIYEGEFEHGVMSGTGTYHYKNGDRYEGEFADNAINGIGTYYAADGHLFSGEWENGQLVKPGQEVVSEDLPVEMDADAMLREMREEAEEESGAAGDGPADGDELDRMVDDILGQ